MLRKRRPKDPLLPIHNTDPSGKLFTSATRRVNRKLPLETQNYRLQVALVIGILVVVGVCLFAVLGGGKHNTEIHLHKHYHSHTVEKMSNKKFKTETNKAPPTKNATAMTPKTKQSWRPVAVLCQDGSDGFLNDDYCDCADGMDEPGTSACSHITVEKPTFRCVDGTGTVFASRVGDGIKDCQDGSDEVHI